MKLNQPFPAEPTDIHQLWLTVKPFSPITNYTLIYTDKPDYVEKIFQI